MKAIDRLYLVIENLGVTESDFARSIKVDRQRLNKAKNKNSELKTDVLEHIINTYPKLNLYWLITGFGEMWLDGSQVEVNYGPEEEKNLEGLKRENFELQKDLVHKDELISIYKQMTAEMTRHIETLTGKKMGGRLEKLEQQEQENINKNKNVS